jgi:hypothetical protein
VRIGSLIEIRVRHRNDLAGLPVDEHAARTAVERDEHRVGVQSIVPVGDGRLNVGLGTEQFLHPGSGVGPDDAKALAVGVKAEVLPEERDVGVAVRPRRARPRIPRLVADRVAQRERDAMIERGDEHDVDHVSEAIAAAERHEVAQAVAELIEGAADGAVRHGDNLRMKLVRGGI